MRRIYPCDILFLQPIKGSEHMNLTVNEIYKSFGEKSVLRGISLSAESGKALGILGRNGAGKTTLIRIIMQVFDADAGMVTLDGKPINTNKIKIGYLPEERGLYPKQKIMNQLLYFAELKGVDKKTAQQTADKYLKELQMESYKNARLDTLSKGNQQKIQLIAALISNPDIVILDEPFSGLDPVNAGMLKNVVKELIAEGKMVLFSSHQMNYIEEFCDDIIILNGGRAVLSGSIKKIKRSYARNIIELSVENLEDALSKIKNNPTDLIQNVQILDDKLTVTLKNEDDKAEFIKYAADTISEIDCVAVKEPSLAEIFIHYTEGSV